MPPAVPRASDASSGNSSSASSDDELVRASSPSLSGGALADGACAADVPSEAADAAAAAAAAAVAAADADADADWCVVCFENPPNATLEPCGHSNICADCVSRLTKRRCPTCRARAKRVRIFVPWSDDEEDEAAGAGHRGEGVGCDGRARRRGKGDAAAGGGAAVAVGGGGGDDAEEDEDGDNFDDDVGGDADNVTSAGRYVVKTVKQLIAERRMRESRVLEDTLQIVFLGPADVGKRTLVRGLLEKYPLPPEETPPTPSLVTDADADVYGSGSDFAANARIGGARVRLSVLRRGALTSRRMLLDDVRTLKPDILVMCASAHKGPTFHDLLSWDKVLRTNLTVPRLWALLVHPDADKPAEVRDPAAPPIAELDESLNIPATIAAITPAANRPRAHYFCATIPASFSIGLRSLTKDMVSYGRSARDEALAAAVAQAEEMSAADGEDGSRRRASADAASGRASSGSSGGSRGGGGGGGGGGRGGAARPVDVQQQQRELLENAAASSVAAAAAASSASAPALLRPRANSDAERGAVHPLSTLHGSAAGLLGQRTGSLRGLSLRTARESARDVNQSVTNFVNWFTGSPN